MAKARPPKPAPTCPVCSGPLPPPARTGRPRRYCGGRCKRGAEFLARRLARKERRLADVVRDGRRAVARLGTLADELRFPVGGGTPASQLKAAEQELRGVRGRLAALRKAAGRRRRGGRS